MSDAGDAGAPNAGQDNNQEDSDELTSHDGLAAFKLRLAEIEAVPDAKAKVINTDVGMAVQGVFGTIQRVQPFVEELNREAPNFGIAAHLVRLHTVALAVNYLQAKYRILLNSKDTADVEYLILMRRIFQLDGETLAIRGYLKQAQVDELKHTNNHHALAYDVMGLSELILGVYDHPKVRLMTTKEELMEASERANKLFSQLGTRQFGPNAGDEIKILRRKAFALMLELVERLEAFLIYTRREQGDAKSFMASLYGKRARKPGDPKDADQKDEPKESTANESTSPAPQSSDDVPYDVDEINNNVAAATAAAGTAAGAVRPGFPGGLPFLPEEDDDK